MRPPAALRPVLVVRFVVVVVVVAVAVAVAAVVVVVVVVAVVVASSLSTLPSSAQRSQHCHHWQCCCSPLPPLH